MRYAKHWNKNDFHLPSTPCELIYLHEKNALRFVWEKGAIHQVIRDTFHRTQYPTRSMRSTLLTFWRFYETRLARNSALGCLFLRAHSMYSSLLFVLTIPGNAAKTADISLYTDFSFRLEMTTKLQHENAHTSLLWKVNEYLFNKCFDWTLIHDYRDVDEFIHRRKHEEDLAIPYLFLNVEANAWPNEIGFTRRHQIIGEFASVQIKYLVWMCDFGFAHHLIDQSYGLGDLATA